MNGMFGIFLGCIERRLILRAWDGLKFPDLKSILGSENSTMMNLDCDKVSCILSRSVMKR